MMELIRSWLLGITCAAMVLALAEAITPEGGIRRIGKIAGGLLLLVMAIQPVLKLDENALRRALDDYRLDVGDHSEQLTEQNDLLYKTIIAENTAAYILDKAEGLGISCEVEVSVAYDEGGAPYPHGVRILGDWTQTQQTQLSTLVEEELGIPPERQSFERAPS